ncbi:isochorismatase family protein [mine drainage metagenome]|uniref:Isochorismatase family protein n=1 Tax=mine drainage metagenome TaxID=410659 RepID=A0A1J5QGC3_9ZZZZ
MNPALFADRLDGQLVLIDAQEKLSAVMPVEAWPGVLRNCAILLQAARLLEIPAIHTEQYPRGLGATLPELAQWLSADSRVEKTCFSCCEESAFCDRLDDTRRQVVLTGMEAHICVLQTALQLQEMGRQVFVVEDAVISRNPAHHANAMARLRQAGIIVSNTESMLFEWLKVAEGDAFRQVARLIR